PPYYNNPNTFSYP
ncbi:hypothetical protein S7711_10286, partial [Stachybotrys chartarum IBT 7711]